MTALKLVSTGVRQCVCTLTDCRKAIVLQTEGLGSQAFHGGIILLIDRHTASAVEMVVAFARENNFATIVGERPAGRLARRSP